MSTSRIGRALSQQVLLPLVAGRRRLDVLHGPANAAPVVTPGVTRLVTIHDLIGLDRNKTQHSLPIALVTRAFIAASARTADRVITDASVTRSEIAEKLGVPRHKIDVVPLGVRPPTQTPSPEGEVRRRLALERRRVLLCVAQKRPYKNQAGLIRALGNLGPDSSDTILILVGEPTPYEEELRMIAHDLRLEERVRLLRWVDDGDLEALYGLASVVVSPSLVEGFGLPVLEAMARGVPVACSDREPLSGVAGNAALLFDPTDSVSIARALDRILSDRELGADLIAKGHERVRLYTWERTARETLASYRRAIAGKHRRMRAVAEH
jgi:glycosyltransferase involved in cell wall biosynthesis